MTFFRDTWIIFSRSMRLSLRQPLWVLIGLLQLNRNSYLRVNPGWRPTLLNRLGQQTNDFKMVDFLTFAGVSPAQRGQ